MNPDSFRIEAQLVARNRAQAAASRPNEAGFTRALDQAARQVSDDDRRIESMPPAQSDRSGPLASQMNGRIDHESDAWVDHEPAQGSRPSTDTAHDDEPAGSAARGPEPTGHRTSTHQAAELRRLLKQFQDNRAAARSLQVPESADAAADEASGASPSAVGDARPTRAASSEGLQDLAEAADGVGSGQGTESDRPIGARTLPEAAPPAAESAMSHRRPDLASLERRGRGPGPAASPGRPDPAAGESLAQMQSASPSVSKAPRGHAAVSAGPADPGALFGAALQRAQDSPITPGFLSPQGAESSSPGRAASGETPNGLGQAGTVMQMNPASPSLAGHLSSPPFSTPAAAETLQGRLPYAPGDPRFGEALGERLSWMIRDGLQQAEITLNPQELGPIRIALSMEGDAAQLGIQADHPFTRQTIEEALPRLKALLAEQGVQLGQTQVGEGSSRSADGQSGQDRGDAPSRGLQVPASRGDETESSARAGLRTGQVALRSLATGRIDVFA